MNKFKLILLLLLCFVIFPFAAKALDLSGWAWSENIGWISFNSSDPGAGGSPYKVEISTSGGFLGYAWSESIGWISFERSDTGNPPSDDPGNGSGYIAKINSGQLGKSDTLIEGWARALSYGDGWDGWIRFNHGEDGEAYVSSDYELRGWAWGGGDDLGNGVAGVVGWISFNRVNCDSDNNNVTDTGNYDDCPVGQTVVDYAVLVGAHLECNELLQCVSMAGTECPGGGCCESDDDCCVCSWENDGCGNGGCEENEMHQILSCDPAGCQTGSDCTIVGACRHTECDGADNCTTVESPGTDECGDDYDDPENNNDMCNVTPMIWKWWEIIAR